MIMLIISILLYLTAVFLLVGFRMEKTAGVLLLAAGILAVLRGTDRLLCAALLLLVMFLYLIPIGSRRRRRA